MKKLSKPQRKVAECIQLYLDWHDRSPSLGEIGQHTSLEALEVYVALVDLKKLGWLRYHPYRRRAYELLHRPCEWLTPDQALALAEKKREASTPR